MSVDKQIEEFIGRNGWKRRDENVCARNNNVCDEINQ
jgi:hypothetical protein